MAEEYCWTVTQAVGSYAVANHVPLHWILSFSWAALYEGRSESKERFAVQRYLLIIGKKQNMQFYHTPSPTSPRSHLGH